MSVHVCMSERVGNLHVYSREIICSSPPSFPPLPPPPPPPSLLHPPPFPLPPLPPSFSPLPPSPPLSSPLLPLVEFHCAIAHTEASFFFRASSQLPDGDRRSRQFWRLPYISWGTRHLLSLQPPVSHTHTVSSDCYDCQPRNT